MRESSFVLICCQAGAEAVLKKEIAREHPELRFAYSRPGFVTFKLDPAKPSPHSGATLAPDLELRSVFARAYSLSLGKSKGDPAPVLELAREIANASGVPPRLHVWERDQHPPGEEPKDFVHGLWAQNATDAIAAASKRGDFDPVTRAQSGDWVVDVVVVEENEWWLGCHRHSPAHAPWPGSVSGISMPEDSPSRAYVKLEEALTWSGAPVLPGDIAVEIGSAPGGASLALLNRGVRVVGIDPGEMDPRVLSNPGFIHFQRPVARVLREELPQSVQWLLLDMNVEPRISLFAVDRLAGRMTDCLLGLFLTVKLNRWSIADEIPSMIEHVRAMGMSRVRATQLPSNRQEILIHGMSRKGLMRRNKAN